MGLGKVVVVVVVALSLDMVCKTFDTHLSSLALSLFRSLISDVEVLIKTYLLFIGPALKRTIIFQYLPSRFGQFPAR